MQIDFLSVLIVVVSLVILAVPGFLLVKGKLLNESSAGAISTIVLYGCQPLLVFMSFQETYTASIAINILFVALLATAVHFAMFGLVALLFPNKNDDRKVRIVKYASCFSNCGFMGIPFLQMLFADTPYAGEIIIYAAVVISIFNILNWTVGVYMITKDKTKVSLKKVLLNPTIIAVVIGALFFFIIKQPIAQLAEKGTVLENALSKIMGSLDQVGNMVTPLSMFVIGMRLANVKIKQLFLDKWAYVVCVMKLAVMSCISVLLVVFLPVSVVVKYVIFFLFSMPSATSSALFAVKFGGDSESASIFVLLSTILCIVTIPLTYLIFSGALGAIV